jgi:hypothetical protein
LWPWQRQGCSELQRIYESRPAEITAGKEPAIGCSVAASS